MASARASRSWAPEGTREVVSSAQDARARESSARLCPQPLSTPWQCTPNRGTRGSFGTPGRAEHENGLIIPGFGGSSPSLSTSCFTSWPALLEHLTGRSSPLLQCELPLFFRGLRPEHRAHRDIEGSVPGSLGSRSEERRVGKECRARWWEYH